MAISVVVDTKRLERAFQLAPKVLRERLYKAAGRVGSRYLGYHRARRLKSPSGGIPEKGVRARARFKANFKKEVSGNTLDSLKLRIYAKGEVARRQEFGGAVRAKSGKYLVVPMPAAKNAKGFVKKKAYDYLRSGRLIPIKRGKKTFLALKRAKNQLQFFFHLERTVRLKPRLGFLRYRGEWGAFKPKGMRDFQYGVRAAINHVFKHHGK